MRVVIHRNVPDDVGLRQQWNALAAEMDRPEVFYTHEWAVAMERAYGDLRVPWLLLQYVGEALIGVAALAIETGQQAATFLAGTTADYCDVLSRPDDRVGLMDCVLAELRKAGVDEIVLANVPSDSATIRALRSVAGKYKYRAFCRVGYMCQQVQLGSTQQRQELKTKLNKRKIFRRGINFLGRQGKVTLVHHTTREAIDAVLPEFAVSHVARFLTTGRLSNFVSRRRRVFAEELARLLSDSKSVVLSQLFAGDRPVAWNYGFQFRGSWFWYQPTFDTRYEQISPGYCLLSKLIVEACDDAEIKSVDLGLGEEEYKDRFANDHRMTLHATVTTSPVRHVAEIVRYGAARVAMLSPRVENGLRTGVQQWNAVRSRLRQAGPRGFAVSGARRLSEALSGHTEVLFYEWPASGCVAGTGRAMGLSLEPATLQNLATAAMQFEGDDETGRYLLRAASRLKNEKATGFVLLHGQRSPVHFCWSAAFEGFHIDELNAALSAPSPNASLIFDCWTPPSVRGSGYYADAVGMVARRLLQEGQSPWIFSVESNRASIRGLTKTAFELRYSMVRRKTLMTQSVKKVFPMAQPAAEVSARS